MEQKSAVNVVFGAMTLGSADEQSRVKDLETCSKILDIFQKHGHYEIDTARVYGGGSSEEYLGKLEYQKRGLVMDTKLYPTNANVRLTNVVITHKPEDLRKYLLESLKALGAKKVDMWYLHAPDRTVPYEDTLREVNNLHKEGYFDRFGISNYMSWEVAQICAICDKNGWIKPVVYQGIYNSVHRAVEEELFPCLRAHKMAFYAFNPLAGGFFTGRFSQKEDEVESGSRFDPNKNQGKLYRTRYWKDEYFEALEMIKPLAEKNGLTLTEIALRWMNHHSLLKRELGDAIIIGASSVSHIEQNLVDLEKGPLPQEIVDKLDEAWKNLRGVASKYFH